jgi:hypothetical protein
MTTKTKATTTKMPMTNPISISFLGSMNQIDNHKHQCYHYQNSNDELHFNLLFVFYSAGICLPDSMLRFSW